MAAYIDIFQGLPLDAIYCVRSKYMKNHSDMKFMDYKQIYNDFELICPEKLIERCIVIAPRTKDNSVIHSQNLTEQTLNKRQFQYGYDEDKELMDTYLCNEEVASSNRLD